MSFITSPGNVVPPFTAGGVVYGTGSQAVVNSAGTVGQVLTSAGAGTPTWATATPAAVAFAFISSQTVTTAVSSIDFTSGITSTYDDYQIIFENMKSSASSVILQFFLRQSAAFSTSYSIMSIQGQNLLVNAIADISKGYIGSNFNGASTATTWRGNLLLQSVNSTTARVPSLMGIYSGLSNGATEICTDTISGASNTAAAVNGFRISYSAGNIVTGTVRLYGIAKS